MTSEQQIRKLVEAAVNRHAQRDAEEIKVLRQRLAALERAGVTAREGAAVEILKQRRGRGGADPIAVAKLLEQLAGEAKLPWERDRIRIVAQTLRVKAAGLVDVTKGGKASRS